MPASPALTATGSPTSAVVRLADGREALRVESMAGWPTVDRAAMPTDRRVQLSRFAYLRRHADSMIIESSLSTVRLVIMAAPVAALVAASVAPRRIDELAAPAELDPADVTTVLVVLWRSGMLTGVDAGGMTDEDTDASLTLWEFHDAVFHTRSRAGLHDYQTASVYPGAARRLRALPAVREAYPPVAHPADRPVVALPRPGLDALARTGPPFSRVVEARRSERRFAGAPSLDQLGELLYRTVRVRRVFPAQPGQPRSYETSDRPYPNAGAAYELEVYLAVGRSAELTRGLYHYHPVEHTLRLVAGSSRPFGALLEHARISTAAPEQPPVLVVLAARFPRLTWKYRAVCYANTQKNVGVLLHHLQLTSTAMGLASCPVGNGNLAAFAATTGLAVPEESSVGELMLGRPVTPRPGSAPPAEEAHP